MCDKALPIACVLPGAYRNDEFLTNRRNLQDKMQMYGWKW